MKARIQDKVVHSPYRDIDIPVRSFYSLVKERLQIEPDNLALVDNTMSLTRGDLLVRLQRYAVGFKRHGVRPGDRVLIHLHNGVENLVASLGCILSGATVVGAKPSFTQREIRYQAEDSGSTHVLTEVQFAENVVATTASLKMKNLFSMGPAVGFVSAADFSTLDETEFQECTVFDPKNTLMAVTYTSGSTGLPKGAEISHYNFVACFYMTCEHLPWSSPEIFIDSNPITHISGLFFQTLAVLLGAIGVVVSSSSTPIEIMDAIDKYKATVMIITPLRCYAIVGEMRRTGRRLPTMKHITVAGSVLTNWLSNAIRSAFEDLQTLCTMLCMTEACFFVSAHPRCLENGDIGSDLGFPAVTVTVKVIDSRTREKLGPKQIGEICFKSASMVRRYYNRPKESADLFDEDGWMKSGDAGYYDEDGRLYFAERLKQMIKCMGNQVVPAELEELLLQKHGDVIAEVSVVGLPHDEYEEAAAAAVVLTEKGRQQDYTQMADSIKATVAANLSVQKHLYGGVFFMDSLPKTETAKVNRTALARLLGQGKQPGQPI